MMSIFVFTFILASVATSTIASPECPERPCEDISCADVWDPVCATDGNGIYRTFGNVCEILQKTLVAQMYGIQYVLQTVMAFIGHLAMSVRFFSLIVDFIHFDVLKW
ncbi:hypothetical protein QE152_g23331 [Popillia japonica]|uniref:Kazal-like domain-containing protein n=1 Tax=Popillia japonica TaxID=7064 RepID=A0AAW1KIB3_POPJA